MQTGPCYCAIPDVICPRPQAVPTPQLGPAEWEKILPLPVSETELLNIKYYNCQMVFPHQIAMLWNSLKLEYNELYCQSDVYLQCVFTAGRARVSTMFSTLSNSRKILQASPYYLH